MVQCGAGVNDFMRVGLFLTNKYTIIILICSITGGVLTASSSDRVKEPFRIGLVANYYNEPAFKPGVTLGLDWETAIGNNWALGVTAPTAGYFYFPYNYEAFYFYPELSLRHTGKKGFYFSLGAGAGLSLSRKIVPVYNLDGKEIQDDFSGSEQLVLLVQVYFGVDCSRRASERPYRLYGSLGWKGLYPNNLGFQNQPMMQIGVNYKIGSRTTSSGEEKLKDE